MKKTTLMKSAHQIARIIVNQVGDYQIALSMAMKYMWQKASYGKKRMGAMAIEYAAYYICTPKAERESIAEIDGMGFVPRWIAQNNLSHEEYIAVRDYKTSAYVVKETEKAVDICFNTDMGSVWMWCPKSVIKK